MLDFPIFMKVRFVFVVQKMELLTVRRWRKETREVIATPTWCTVYTVL